MTVQVRYWSLTVALALGGGFLIVDSQAFSPATAAKIAFGVAIMLTATEIAAFAVARSRGRMRFWALPALGALLGALTIAAMAPQLSPAAQKWLAFSSGVGFLVLSLTALAFHELTYERALRVLVLELERERDARNSRPADGGSNGSAGERRPPMRPAVPS